MQRPTEEDQVLNKSELGLRAELAPVLGQCGWETWKQATSYCDTACSFLFAADGVPGAPAYTFTALVAKRLVVLISPGGPVGSA